MSQMQELDQRRLSEASCRLTPQMSTDPTLDDTLNYGNCPFHFPEDIERLIFEEAAYSDTSTALRLVTVARRTQLW